MVHLTLLTVPVPVGTKDSTARTEVHTTKNMHAAICSWSICTLCISYLQLVVPPVRMEEHALVHLPMLPVSVPVGTKDPTARPEVHTTKNMHAAIELWHIYSLYIYMFLHLRIFAVTSCTPACQNGGTCHHSTYSSYCHCPSGYSGSYCQNRGMHKQLCM